MRLQRRAPAAVTEVADGSEIQNNNGYRLSTELTLYNNKKVYYRHRAECHNSCLLSHKMQTCAGVTRLEVKILLTYPTIR